MRSTTAAMLVLICFGAVGCTGQVPAPASTPIPGQSGKLRFFDLVNLDVRDVPLMMALESLEAQGYTVERTYMASSTLIAEALARGDADIGLLNNQTMWTAINKGAAARTIAQFTVSTMVVAATQEIKSCHELDGKRVGAPNTRGLSPALFELYLKQNCSDANPQILVIPEGAGRVAALLAGEIDAAHLPGEELLKLDRVAPGKFHALLSHSQSFPMVQVDGLHVRRPWAEENPEVVKDFLRALLKAHRQVAADAQLLYDESVKRLSLDQATAKAVGEAHLRSVIWDANGGLTPENIQYTIDFLTSFGALPAGLRVEDVADLTYLNAVLDEIGRK